MSKKKEVIDVDAELAKLNGKSAKVRYLDSQGWTRSQIKDKLGIRYQHVRNVLVTQLKKDMK